MLNPLVFALTTLVQGQPAPNARQVLTTAASKQVQRLSAVDNYTIIQTVNGSAVPLHFGRAAAQDRGADDPGSGTGRADDAQRGARNGGDADRTRMEQGAPGQLVNADTSITAAAAKVALEIGWA